MRGRLSFPSALALPALLLMVALLYAPTLSYGFAYDDLWQVPLSTWERVLAEFQPGFHASPDAFRFRPVFILVTGLERAAWGLHPLGFHLVNLGLHLVNVALVFRLSQIISKRIGLAFGAGLIWNVLPGTAYSVAWIAQLNDLLCAFFILLSTWALIQGMRQRAVLWSILSALSYGLGLLSKEMAVPLIVVLGVGLVWLRREESLGKAWGRLVPHTLVLTAYFGTRTWLTGFLLPPPVESAASAYGGSPWSQLAVTGFHYVESLVQLIIPIYELPSWGSAALFVLLTALLGGMWLPLALRLWRAGGNGAGRLYRLGLVWCLSFLVLAALAWGHPRHLYVPGIGFAALASALLGKALEQPLSVRRRVAMQLAVAGLAALNLAMTLGVQALFAPASPKVLDYAACYVSTPLDRTLQPYAQAQVAQYAPATRCVVGTDAYWEGLTLNGLFEAKRQGLRPLVAQWLRALFGP